MKLLEEKKALRHQLSARRNALSKTEMLEKNRKIYENLRQIVEFNQAKSIFCYISYLTEVETHKLIKQWLATSIRVAVPKIFDKTTMHAVKLSSWDNLEPDKLGILTPKSDEIDAGPFDISITPGLGFTQFGARLGYGRGYYDRWFSNNDVKQKIGVCFEEQIVNELPTEITDITLDLVVSEKNIYSF